MKFLTVFLSILLAACAGVTPPPGQEQKREFTQEIDKSYLEIYRVAIRQMTECYAITGMLGNGYKVIPEFDPVAKQANIEVSIKGWIGDSSPDSDSAYRMVTIEAVTEKKSRVTVKGTKPNIVYGTHTMIPKWLAGSTDCT